MVDTSEIFSVSTRFEIDTFNRDVSKAGFGDPNFISASVEAKYFNDPLGNLEVRAPAGMTPVNQFAGSYPDLLDSASRHPSRPSGGAPLAAPASGQVRPAP